MKKSRARKFMIAHIILGIIMAAFIIGLIKCAMIYGWLDNFFGPNICTETQCFSIEIVETQEERKIGLMDRTSMKEKHGMLFVFDDPGIYSFWMKNTLIPLDIIRLDANYKVLYIQENASPCKADPCPSYNPIITSSYALEINGGVASEIGLKIGDRMKLK